MNSVQLRNSNSITLSQKRMRKRQEMKITNPEPKILKKRGPKGPSKYTKEFVEDQADKILAFAISERLPTEQEYGFTQHLDIDRFSDWINPKDSSYNEKFVGAFKQFKQIRHFKWLKAAANGEIPPAIFIFFSKNVLGWRDEQYLKGEGNETKQIIQVYLPQAGGNQVAPSPRTAGLLPSKPSG